MEEISYNNIVIIPQLKQQLSKTKKRKKTFLRFFVAVLDSDKRVIFLQNVLFERKENILIPPNTQGERNGITEQKWITLQTPKRTFYKLKRVQYQLYYYLTLLSGWIVWKPKITVDVQFLGFICKLELFSFLCVNAINTCYIV